MGREQRYVPYRSVKNPTEVVVIFKTHLRDGADSEAYRKTSRRMHELVEQIPGFISIKAYTGEDGDEIDLVRFANEGALNAWKEQPEHLEAQRRGREEFYDRYSVQACKVVRDYEFRIDELPRTQSDASRDGAKPQGLSSR
ncbi:MAG: antibiotic biosynthesis monooxygenase [Methanobacteriota archaeon]|nr:MAG: antibiotic biosynthesis monooxygenase [Euryarchaeota archaeon]